MEPLNNIDVIILIGVALSMLVAFIRGFVKEVLSILGLALFVVLTVYLSPLLTPWMNQFIASKLMAQFVVFLLIMAVFYAIWIIGTDKLIAKIRKVLWTGCSDWFLAFCERYSFWDFAF